MTPDCGFTDHGTYQSTSYKLSTSTSYTTGLPSFLSYDSANKNFVIHNADTTYSAATAALAGDYEIVVTVQVWDNGVSTLYPSTF